MFWVGFDARSNPPEEFQADSPQNLGRQGQPPRCVLHAVLVENSGRFGVRGLDLWRRGLR